MKNLPEPGRYRKIQSKKGLLWQREKGGILLLNPTSGESTLLSGFEAELWDWLSFLSWRQVVELSAAFLQVSSENAEEQIAHVLSGWIRKRWIEFVEEAE